MSSDLKGPEASTASTEALNGEIFVSYSSSNNTFVDRLSSALESRGHSTWVDTEDIRYADNWRDAVLPAIERAPAVIFITSKASLTSQNCLAELEYAQTLGKRIIPVIAETLDSFPEALKDRVRRDFRDPQRFDEELLRLIGDVTTDPQQVDIHTYLAIRAARWRASKAEFLGPDELKQADAFTEWAAAHPDDQPRPTALIVDFIQASKQYRRARAIRTVVRTIIIAAVVVTLVAGAYLATQWWSGIPRSGVDVQLIDGDDEMRQRTETGVAQLREGLEAAVPDKSSKDRLLIATWNIRMLGSSRSDEALHYIAEIISHFDIVAIQELGINRADYDRIRGILGGNWQSIESDIKGSAGNRLAFLFDSRKVSLGGSIGELDVGIPAVEEDDEPYRNPYFVSFNYAGLELALCNVHIRWGDDPLRRVDEITAIVGELSRKRERGRDFPNNVVLLGDLQAGSVRGQILEAIEEAGFLLPPALRDLPTSVGERPYDQIAFWFDAVAPLEVGKGGVVNFFERVFSDDQEAVYEAETTDSGPRRYVTWRTYQMSDHFPKWVELSRSD